MSEIIPDWMIAAMTHKRPSYEEYHWPSAVMRLAAILNDATKAREIADVLIAEEDGINWTSYHRLLFAIDEAAGTTPQALAEMGRVADEVARILGLIGLEPPR